MYHRAFLFNATIANHKDNYKEEDPQFIMKFSQAIYVDDVSYGEEDNGGTFELFLNSKQRLAVQGFNLSKSVTDSPDWKLGLKRGSQEFYRDSRD